VPPIEVQKVSRAFGAIRALDDITLEVDQGEIFGLLGPNGSGKSTLLRILSLLIPPSSGSISLLGEAIRERDPSLLKQMGVVFDQDVHYDQLTGYENAWFFGRTYGLSSPTLQNRLYHLFKSLSLWERKEDPVGIYSHGMKRKLALIEALAHQPRLIVLDEPSLGLDYYSRMSLYQILRDEADSGASIILATNDVHEARLLCDRVALMNHGRLLATGTPEELIRSLGGFTVLNMQLDRPVSPKILNQVEGIEHSEMSEEDGGRFRVTLLARDEPYLLPSLIREITQHASLLGMEVKRPDLGDVMLQLGGRI
jgi:ABC-2 type transport system ATP-binding protein